MRARTMIGAVVACVVVIAGCGSDRGAGTTTTIPETTTTISTTTTAVATTSTVEPRTTTTLAGDAGEAASDAVPWSMEAAGPGTFASALFVAPFTFVLGDGWLPIFPEAEQILTMRLPGRLALFVLENEADSVPSLVEAVDEQPGVDVANLEQVAVGGVEGVRFEAVGDGVARLRSAAGEATYDLQEEAARMTAVAVAGTVVVFVEITPTDDPDTARAESLAVIDSITWVSE